MSVTVVTGNVLDLDQGNEVEVIVAGIRGEKGQDGRDGTNGLESLDWLNVKDSAYGAVGNGIADDTGAVQDAIDAAAAAAFKGPLFLPSGEYKITSPLSVPDGLAESFALIGNGSARTSITYTGSGAFLTLDPSVTPGTASRRTDWRIEGFTLTGPGSGTAGSIGLHLNNCLRGVLRDVGVWDFETGVLWDAHDLANGAATYYNTAYNLHVFSCVENVVYAGGANSNKWFGGSCKLATTVGIRIGDQATTHNTSDVGIFGVAIEGNSGTGVIIDGYGNQLIGCRLENYPSFATADVHLNAAGGTAATHGTKNTVQCYVSSVATEVAVLDESPNRDNLIIWPGYLQIGNANGALNNQGLLLTRTAAADGEPLIDTSDVFDSSGSPIGWRYRARRFGGKFFSFQKDNGAGSYWTQLEATTNTVSGAPELWFGGGTSATLDTNLYRSAANVLKTDDAFIAGTSFTIGSGATITGHLSAAVALNFGSIAAGTTAELTATVTGAAVGNVTAIATPNTTIEAGLIWSAYVSAADTVTVRLANVTSGAIDPANKGWRIDVWNH